MREINTIILSLKHAGRAAFRTREYTALVRKSGYARLLLHRLKKRGELVLIRNGWWAFPNALPEAVACEVSAPSYISFHSALFLHGLTTQVPRTIQVAVARKTKKYTVFGINVKEFKVKKENFTNFSRKDGVLLASPEKAFADCLSLPRTCPEIVLVEVSSKVDTEKVKSIIYSRSAERLLKKVIQGVKQI